jgi:hypothetical protein
MHEPLSDKITNTERETVPERRSGAPMEREVQLEVARASAKAIRERVDGGFYQTPAVIDVVARRILERGDLWAR